MSRMCSGNAIWVLLSSLTGESDRASAIRLGIVKRGEGLTLSDDSWRKTLQMVETHDSNIDSIVFIGRKSLSGLAGSAKKSCLR